MTTTHPTMEEELRTKLNKALAELDAALRVVEAARAFVHAMEHSSFTVKSLATDHPLAVAVREWEKAKEAKG